MFTRAKFRLELLSHLVVGGKSSTRHICFILQHMNSLKNPPPESLSIMFKWPGIEKKTTPLKQAVQLIYYKNDYSFSFPFIIYSRNMHLDQHIGLMYGVFTYMFHRNQPFM